MIGSVNSISDMVTMRAMALNRLALNGAYQRLATGLRINSGADDPAGLIASASMSATLAALDAETAANQRAIHVADTADAALGQISDLLIEAKSLASANANSAGLSAEEKQANQLEIDSILASVDRIASTTSFNGVKLLSGTGSISASGQAMDIDASGTSDIGKTEIDGTSYALSDVKDGKALATTGARVSDSVQVIDAAINQVATSRGKIGAFSKNTLESRLDQISTSREHMLKTVSIIRDADYALETSVRIRAELLQRSSTLLISKSHRSGESLLDLLA